MSRDFFEIFKGKYLRLNGCKLTAEEDVALKAAYDQVFLDTWTLKIERKELGDKKELVMLQKRHRDHRALVDAAATDLRHALRVKPASRGEVTSQLLEALRDTSPFAVIRTDIAKFFESVNFRVLVDRIRLVPEVSLAAIKVLDGLLRSLEASSSDSFISLPRGLPVSSPLAEFTLRALDTAMRANPDVRYYARYVDDIVAVVSPRLGKVEMRAIVESALSRCKQLLTLNSRKTMWQPIDGVPRKKTTQAQPTVDIEFLGYRYMVTTSLDEGLPFKPRKVSVHMAKSKVKRLQRRVALALRAYSREKKFELLKLRLAYLTANYRVFRRGRPTRHFGGVYFNYPLLSRDLSKGPRDMIELDNFLRALLRGKIKGGYFASLKGLALPMRDFRKVSSLSFEKGYLLRVKVHLTAKRMKMVRRAWWDER